MGLTIIDSSNIFQKDVIGNVRTAQEDSHDIAVLTPNGDVFVVCDGMGGHVGGKQASTIAVKSIIEYLKKERYPEPRQALNEALQFANMQILGYANEHPELRGMGTTACILLLQDSEAYIAHVGDSRIYLYLGKEKQLKRITKDHSFVQALVDAGQITEEEAEHHPNKNRILKALGIKPDLAPSFGNVKPKNGDVFLICSDGLSGMISDATMRDVLMQNMSIEDKGETLVNLALEAGGHDNITVELIQITNSPHGKSDFINCNPINTKPPRLSKRKLVAVIVFAAIIVVTLCSFPMGSWLPIRKIEKRIENNKERIGELDSLISSNQRAIDSLETELGDLGRKFEKLKSEATDSALLKKMKLNYTKQCEDPELILQELEDEKVKLAAELNNLKEELEVDSLRLDSIKNRKIINRRGRK